ncbi:MAG: cadherin domain-containing protein, partial [Planctomycetia bacterium]|nr:cadherin domain-containing protein [Planctomycetia bacterium]
WTWQNQGGLVFERIVYDGLASFASFDDVFAVDLDGDEDLDLVLEGDDAANSIVFNDGTGGVVDARTSVGTGNLRTFADVDGDGDADAVLENSGQLNVWKNNGAGAFSFFAGFTSTGDVAFGDFDLDGDLDAFIVQQNVASTVWLNDGSGVFTNSGQALATQNTAQTVALGDLDNDGDLDAYVNGFSDFAWLNQSAPVLPGTQALTIYEHNPTGTVVGSVAASDGDAGDALVYSVLSGNDDGVFAVNSATGQITVADGALLDYETLFAAGKTIFTLTVRVTDAAGLTDTGVVVITVGNLMQAPSVPAGQALTVAENVEIGTVVGTVLAMDPEAALGDRIVSYSIVGGTGQGQFAIDASGQINVATAALNFEATPTLTLLIQATDADGNTNTLNQTPLVTIQLTNVNEAPGTTAIPLTVYENRTAGEFLATLYHSDPDAGDSFTYDLVNGEDTAGQIVFDPATLKLYVGSDPSFFDLDGNRQVLIQVTDAAGLTGFIAANFTILAYANAPVLNDLTVAVAENGAANQVVTTLAALDADLIRGDSLSYQIIDIDRYPVGGGLDGNPTNYFTLDAATGVLRVDAAQVSANDTLLYTVTVRVTDEEFQTDTAVITVHITNINQAPVLDDATFTIVENRPTGTVVGTLAATDGDLGEEFTYTLLSASSLYAVSATGVITVLDGALLDYENPAAQSVALTVQVTDRAGVSDTATITIELTDLNQPPHGNGWDGGLTALFYIDENAAVGTQLGSLVNGVVIDPEFESGDRLNFGLAGSTTAYFSVSANPATIQFFMADNALLDFETASTTDVQSGARFAGSFQATVVDTEGQTGFVNIRVYVRNVDEPADVYDGQVFSVAESALTGDAVGTVLAFNEASDVFTIVAGNDAGVFTIDSATGAITIADPTALDYETMQSYTLTVRLSDPTNAADFDEAQVTLHVANIYEAGLTVTKTDGQTFAREGDELTYTITVTNTGDSDAVNAIVRDLFTGLTDLELVSVTTSAGSGVNLGSAAGSASFRNPASEYFTYAGLYPRHVNHDPLDTGVDLGATLGGSASLAFWINTTQVGDAEAYRAPGVTGMAYTTGDDQLWGWLDQNGKIGLTANGSVQSATAINDGAWHHIVLTRDAATGALQVYVDGVLDGSGTSTAGVLASSFAQLGYLGNESPEAYDIFGDGTVQASHTRGLEGFLDAVRVFDRVLSAVEVGDVMNDAGDAPAAVQAFDFTTSTTAVAIQTNATVGALPGGLMDTITLPVGAAITYVVQGTVGAALRAAEGVLSSAVTVTTALPPRDAARQSAADATVIGLGAEGGSGTFVKDIADLGGNTSAVALGDVDQDGDLDAFVGNALYFNDGAGNFSDSGQVFTYGDQAAALADLDDDGDLDAYVDNRILINQGGTQGGTAGVFVLYQQLVSPNDSGFGGSNPRDVAFADLDGDGDLDALIANISSGTRTEAWLNDGTGFFSNRPQTDAIQGTGFGNTSRYIAAADFLGTGIPWAVVVDTDGQLRGATNDGFAQFDWGGAPSANGAKHFALGDLDGDGDLDLAVAAGTSKHLLFNHGDGTFTNQTFITAHTANDVVLGDLDGDGDLDLLALTLGYGGTQEVFWNDGAGAFSAGPTFDEARESKRSALGDLDGDGDLDLWTVGFHGSQVWFHQDQPNFAGEASWTAVEETDANLGGLTVADLDSDSLTLTIDVAAIKGAVVVGGVAYQHFEQTGTAAALNVVLAGLIFRPADAFSGTATPTLSIDDGSLSETISGTVTVAASSDPPTLTVPGSASTPEDTALAITGIAVDDEDSASVTVRLTTTQGTLRFQAGAPSVPGLTVSGLNSAVLTVSGAPDALDLLLPFLEFAPTANTAGAATISVVVSDGANSVSRQLTVTITPANDAPQLTVPGSQNTLEDTARSIAGVAVADVDGDALTISLSVGSGQLTLGGQSGAVLSRTGSAAVLNNLLAGLTFTPATDFSGQTTVSISLSDGSATTPGSFTIDVQAINDAPTVLLQNTVRHLSETADTSSRIKVADVVVADDGLGSNALSLSGADAASFELDGGVLYLRQGVSLDLGSQTQLTVTVAVDDTTVGGTPDATASLTIQITNGINDAPLASDDVLSAIDEDSGDRTIAFISLLSNDATGPANEGYQLLTIVGVQNAVGGTVEIQGTNVVFHPTAHFNGTARFEYLIQDDDPTTPLTDVGQVSFAVTAVNDAPQASAPAAVTLVVNGATALNGVSVADVDAGSVQVTLTAGIGTLTLGGVAGLTFTEGDGDGDAQMTFIGAGADINSALASLSYRGPANTSLADTVTLTVDDQGNTGSGGALSATASIAITPAFGTAQLLADPQTVGTFALVVNGTAGNDVITV